MQDHDPRMHGDPRHHSLDIERLTEERDRARAMVVALEEENAVLRDRMTEPTAVAWRARGW